MSTQKAIKNLESSVVDTTTLSTLNWRLIDNGVLTKPCFALKISNHANQRILISFNGSDIHETSYPTLEWFIGPFRDFYFEKGTKIYMKLTGASSGFIYVHKYYVEQSKPI